jgi:hypothetical protein
MEGGELRRGHSRGVDDERLAGSTNGEDREVEDKLHLANVVKQPRSHSLLVLVPGKGSLFVINSDDIRERDGRF